MSRRHFVLVRHAETDKTYNCHVRSVGRLNIVAKLTIPIYRYLITRETRWPPIGWKPDFCPNGKNARFTFATLNHMLITRCDNIADVPVVCASSTKTARRLRPSSQPPSPPVFSHSQFLFFFFFCVFKTSVRVLMLYHWVISMAKSRNGLTAVGLSVLGAFLVLLAFTTKSWVVTDGKLEHPQFERIGK